MHFLVLYRLQVDQKKLRSVPFPRPILSEHFLLSCLSVQRLDLVLNITKIMVVPSND